MTWSTTTASGSASAQTTACSFGSKGRLAAAPASTSYSGLAMRSEPRPGRSRRRVGLYAFAAVVMVAAAGVSRGAAPKFRPDDPIQIDDDRTIDAKGARPIEGSNAYDFAEHT